VQVPPTALAPRPSTTSKKHTRIVQRRTKKPAAMTEVEELIELPPYLGPHCQDQVPAEIILDRLFEGFCRVSQASSSDRRHEAKHAQPRRREHDC
jgi:hypothetical protein